jgi:hypothetical protein
MKRILCVAIMATAGVILFSMACTKKNEQELSQTIVCTTDSMSYSKDIVPILESYCYGCHGNGSTGGSGGINLDGYSNLKVRVDNGELVGCVSHAEGFVPMPFDQPKMPDCEVSKVVAWVNQGALNN